MVQQQALTLEARPKPTCRHHWMIEAPRGPISKGVCRLCGEGRDFKNYIEAVPWGEESALAELGARKGAVASDSEDNEAEQV